jgi:hypothetical protein
VPPVLPTEDEYATPTWPVTIVGHDETTAELTRSEQEALKISLNAAVVAEMFVPNVVADVGVPEILPVTWSYVRPGGTLDKIP